MLQRIVFTSANLHYLDKVRVLAKSLKAVEPDIRFVFVLVETAELGRELVATGAFAGMPEIDEVLTLDRIAGGEWDTGLAGRPVVEACTAIKGAATLTLLDRRGTGAVVYLDPDVRVFAPLTPIWQALAEHPVVLTPHLLEPSLTFQGVLDNEVAALKHGVYNLGFMGTAANARGREIACWWAERLVNLCLDRPADGLFTDQRWFDLARVFYPDIGVIRHPGCNVASWNVQTRHVERAANDITVNGEELVFWHFSGFDSRAHRVMLERYAESSNVPMELSDEYAQLLHENRVPELQSRPWSLGRRRLSEPRDLVRRVGSRLTSTVRRHPRLRALVPPSAVARLRRSPRLTSALGLLGASTAQAPSVALDQFVALIPSGATVAISHFGGGGADMVLDALLLDQDAFRDQDAVILSASRLGGITLRGPGQSTARARLDHVDGGNLAAAVGSRSPSRVIVNHGLGNEAWLPDFIRDLDAATPVALLLHDLSWLTQTPFGDEVLSASVGGQIPGVTIPLPEARVRAMSPGDWVQWWQPLFDRADATYAPSQYLADRYVSATCLTPIVGTPPGAFVADVPANGHHASRMVRVAVIGAGVPYKGSTDVREAARAAEELDVNVEFHVFGDVSPVAGLRPSSRVHMRGQLTRTDLVGVLRRERFAIAWFPARAPESYCLALNDAICAGATPVARAVGAFEERLAVLGNGRLYDEEIAAPLLISAMVDLARGVEPPAFLRPASSEQRVHPALPRDDGWRSVSSVIRADSGAPHPAGRRAQR